VSLNWPMAPIWSVATEIRHSIEPSEFANEFFHYSIPVVDETGTGRVESAADVGSAKLLLDGGEVLISKLNPRKGRVLIAQRHELPVVASPEFIALRPTSKITDRFLAYLLSSETTRLYLDANVQSVTRSHQRVTPELVRHYQFRLPPLDRQQRITDFLDAETEQIDRLAALRNIQRGALTTHYQSRLSEVAQELSDRYGTVKVRHVLQKIEQGWSPLCEDRAIRDGEWGVVKAGCVNGGLFDAAQHKALPAGVEPELRYRLRAEDLLMSRASGSVDLIGSIAVIPDGIPSRLLLCDKVYRLRLDRTRMAPPFVAYMLRTCHVREQIKLGISGAEGMANNLPTATVTNLPLPDAPLHEQARIVNDLDSARRAAEDATQLLRQQLAVLSERRQALITAAVTGAITV
jgi:type I restriction enzyme, S subunit